MDGTVMAGDATTWATQQIHQGRIMVLVCNMKHLP